MHFGNRDWQDLRWLRSWRGRRFCLLRLEIGGEGEERRVLHGRCEELNAGAEGSADVFSGQCNRR